MAWWDYPVTQAWSPPTEWGVDIGTPLGTPITAVLPGRVTAEVNATGKWGGEVDIASTLRGGPNDGQQVSQYVLHLDSFAPGLAPGAWVNPGDLLGYSGGQNYGGTMPSGTDYSTGPHTEFGLFVGSQWAGQSVNPMPYLGTGIGAAAPPPPSPSEKPPPATGPLCSIPIIGGLICGAMNVGAQAGYGAGQGVSQAGQAAAGALGAGFGAAAVGVGQSMRGWFTTNVWGAPSKPPATIQSWVTSNIVALLVAVLILLVIFGASQKKGDTNVSIQAVPVPV